MRRIFLYAKLHQGRVTSADLNYEGSFGIDEELLQETGIKENEQIHVLNITNGNRFVTYAIKEPFGSRVLRANGACARLVQVNDRVIICSYAELEEHEIDLFQPRVLFLNDKNNFVIKDNLNAQQPKKSVACAI